ncbi:hypothetical protein PMAYCL1PPCAC_21142, partial [Pristionchus mayeri]
FQLLLHTTESEDVVPLHSPGSLDLFGNVGSEDCQALFDLSLGLLDLPLVGLVTVDCCAQSDHDLRDILLRELDPHGLALLHVIQLLLVLGSVHKLAERSSSQGVHKPARISEFLLHIRIIRSLESLDAC